MSTGERAGLRERTRRAVRADLAELALRLFLERGYEETTIDDIAAAAGLSRRSFFRYFPSKEDVVFGDAEDVAEQVAAAVTARPDDEEPWAVLHAVLRDWEQRIHSAQPDARVLRLIESTPVLRARLHQRRDGMRERITAALRERPGAPLDAFTADLLTGCAAAALDAAGREWLRRDGAVGRRKLIDRAFAALAPGSPPGASPCPASPSPA